MIIDDIFNLFKTSILRNMYSIKSIFKDKINVISKLIIEFEKDNNIDIN